MATASPKIRLGDKPGKSNWVERTGALKPHATNWIYRTAEHLKGKGMPDGRAIAVAVNAARRICTTGDTNFPGIQQVNARSKAEACAAWTKWKLAAARAKASKDLTEYGVMRAIDLAGPRLARGLDLTQAQRDVIDLAFDPGQPRGFHGRWTKIVDGLKKLKPGESKTLHSPSGTKVKRTAGGFKVTAHGKEHHASTAGKAATIALDAVVRAHQPRRVARNMTADQRKPIDLAKRKDTLLSLDATVSRLRKRPELKNASDAELKRMAAARILRRQIRRKLGISDLKKLPKAQLDQLKRLGLVGSRKAPVGAVTSYTIQRGRRKGQTIQVRYGKSGRWSEVRPKATSIAGAKR